MGRNSDFLWATTKSFPYLSPPSRNSARKKDIRTHIEYLASLKKKYDELNIYRPFTTNAKELKIRKEEDQIFSYLTSLDSSYEVIRSQIIRAPELPTISEVVNQIQREDSLREAIGGPQASHGEGHEPHGHAIRFPQNHRNPNSQNHQNWSQSRGEKCSHCKKESHKAGKCYFLHPNLRPKWWIEADSKRGGGGDWNEEKKKEKEGASRGCFSISTEEPHLIKPNGLSEPGSSNQGTSGSSGSGDQMQQILQ